MKLTEQKANKVYDLLVSIAGADEPFRVNFIYHHCKSKDGCDEWRFCGKLGFGGKYYSHLNRVDCYKEDATPETTKLIKEINNALSQI